MAYSLGAFCSDDDKYTDYEAWSDPYFCCEQFFTSTAAFEVHRARVHGPRIPVGRSHVQVRGLPRAGLGTGGGGGPKPVPGRGAGGSGGAVGKKKKGKQRNTQIPPQAPTQSPMSEGLVLGSSFEIIEEGHTQWAAPQPERPRPPPMTASSDGAEHWFRRGSLLSEDVFDGGCEGAGVRGSGGLFGGDGFGGAGAPPAPGTSAGSGAVGNTSAGKNKKAKKKGKKKGKGNVPVQAPSPPSVPHLPDYASLLGLAFEDPLECSEDEYSEEDFFESGHGLYDSNCEDCMDRMRNDYMESFHYIHYDESDEDSDICDDAVDKYMVHCMRSYLILNGAKSAKLAKSSSKKGTQTSGGADNETCGNCKQSFGPKHVYLLHMAYTHNLCGVCESTSQEEQRTGDSRFENEDHYKSSPSCLYNLNFKLGKVQITEVPDFEEDERDQFLCLTCGDGSGSRSALNRHYATDHTKCWSCKIQFDTQDNLCHHFRTSKVHFGKYCLPCEMVFSSKGGMSAHCTETHSAGPNKQVIGELFTCDACTKVVRSFPTEEELEAHLQFEHIRCFPCKREFGQKKSLDNHLTNSSQHNFCIQCDSDFTSSMSLHLHDCHGRIARRDLPKNESAPAAPIQNGSIDDRQLGSCKAQNPVKHRILAVCEDYKNEEDLSCCICHHEFDTLDERKWHEYDNHLWCTKCDKQLASRKAFMRHQRTADGHCMCFECGDHFLTSKSLVLHEQVANHGFRADNVPSDKSVKTRKFVCDDCDYKVVFKTEKELARHLDTEH